MENVKYIPGDWIRIQSIVNWFAKDKDAPLKVVECDCDAKKTLETLRVVERNYDKKSYLIYESDIIPIPITPEILEKNGWKTQNGTAYFLDVTEGYIPYIDIDFERKANDGKLLVEVYNKDIVEIEFVHQLQHILFGLGLDSNLKV